MALAWNAGWVNSPRGFKSRILRAAAGVGRFGRKPVQAGLITVPAALCTIEAISAHYQLKIGTDQRGGGLSGAWGVPPS